MSVQSTTSKSPTSNSSVEAEVSENDNQFAHAPYLTDSSKEHLKQWSSSSRSAQKTDARQNTSTSNSASIRSHSLNSKSSTTPQSCSNTKIIAIVEGRGIARGEIGMACIDIKNPVLLLSQFADTQAYLRLAVQLNVLKPLEIVMPNTSVEHGFKTKLICRIRELFPEISTVTVQRKYFNETKGLQYIQELCASEYKTVEIEVSPKYYCLAACAALLKYFEFKQNVTYATNSLKIVYCTSADTTMINMATARNLELVTNELGKAEHCLYGVLNHTQTPGGDRLLRANILQPPCDLNTINTRLDCISELIEKEELFYDLKSVIGKFVDTEHLLSLCVQIPKEENVRSCEQKIANVICMKHTLELVKPLRNCLSSCSNALFQTYYQIFSDDRFIKLQEKISLVIHTDARWQKGVLNMHMQKCFAVKPNINGLLDVARRAYSESVNDVSDIVKQLEKQYNLPLQVGYSSMRGFFIQISCKLLPAGKELPPIFLKVNKCKNFITCTTEDVIKLNDRIQESLNEIYLMSDIIINEVLNEIREHIGCLYNLTEAVSSIDFLLSLAHVCTLSDHVRPEFSTCLAIKNGRHPVIDKICTTTFIPNNAFLCEEMNFIVLTGANMSGKSTYLKQLAVLQIMAQMGSYIPAEFASFRIADQILTRMGSNSDIEKNYSTFMLQMKEANFVLQHTSDKSLIIMDELGKGTSIEEGCAITYAICEELLKTKAFVLCSTHFTQLTHLASIYPNVENYHFKVDYVVDESVGCSCNFTHMLTPGPCKEKYYGIKIAEISTMPQSIVSEAKNLVNVWSEETRHEPDISTCEENKEKIKLVIHLIQLAQQDSLLDVDGLKAHIQDLQSQFNINITSDSPCDA
ncbi:mutS protein homolog 4 [Caerostris darwini]|uniref:MutS protein homolog 4 n=1 Tax=Caerostris darwini TaxID=1538125 RepID=A0AAV4MGV0_9ARAC|nr:mutS protein homolog 4 [Caerostris darwini]